MRVIAMILSLSILPACKFMSTEDSQTSSNIPQTSVKNQGVVEFCWAYSAVGLIESEILKNSGTSYDLSEEYIGVMYLLEQVSKLGKDYRAGTIGRGAYEEWLVHDVTEGGWTSTSKQLDQLYQDYFTKFNMNGAFELIDKYGLVQESDWRVKISNEEEKYVFVSSIKRTFNNMVKDPNKNLDPVDIFEELTDAGLLPKLSATPLRPSSWNIKPLEQFSIAAGANTHIAAEQAVTKLVQALDNGTAAVIEVGVDWNRIGLDFSPRLPAYHKDLERPVQPRQFNLQGGHAMLVTEYKMRSDIPSGKAFDARDLDYIKVKNSWGSGINEFGREIESGGYYYLSWEYLRDAGLAGHLSFIIRD